MKRITSDESRRGKRDTKVETNQRLNPDDAYAAPVSFKLCGKDINNRLAPQRSWGLNDKEVTPSNAGGQTSPQINLGVKR